MVGALFGRGIHADGAGTPTLTRTVTISEINSDGPKPTENLDRVGVACSAACAAHCAISAMAPGLLVVIGLGALLGSTTEWVFSALAVLFATLALTASWRRLRNRYLAGVFVTGIAGLIIGRGLEVFEVHGAGPAVSIAAGLSLVAAHVFAIILGRRARVRG